MRGSATRCTWCGQMVKHIEKHTRKVHSQRVKRRLCFRCGRTFDAVAGDETYCSDVCRYGPLLNERPSPPQKDPALRRKRRSGAEASPRFRVENFGGSAPGDPG